MPKLVKELDGCYTRVLRTVLNIHWEHHITNAELCGELPKLSHKIKERTRRFAGHCSRSEEIASELIHWKPKHGQRKPGRPKLKYTDILAKDTGLEATELRIAMQDRTLWRAITVRGHHPK